MSDRGYAQRLVEVLGMQSMQALSLFNQTMGIKVLGELNEFIRTNMLEPGNMEQEFQELKKHLSTLSGAQRNIEKSEEQIGILSPLEKHFQSFKEGSSRLQHIRQELETVKIWNSYTKYHLLDEAIRTKEKETRQRKDDQEQLRQKIAAQQEEERQARNQLEQNKAGQRLQQLEKDLENLRRQQKEAEQALRQFTEWCTLLHLPETEPEDDAAYQRIKKKRSGQIKDWSRTSGTTMKISMRHRISKKAPAPKKVPSKPS